MLPIEQNTDPLDFADGPNLKRYAMYKILRLIVIGLVFMSRNLLGEEDYREITRQSYDRTASEYQENTLKLQPEVKAKVFLSHLSPNSKILDLGCGPGRDAKYFVDKGYRVVGVDISPQMIALARDSVPQADFIVSDIESLNLNCESVDAIWASASLLHVSKQAMPSVLANLYRTLKPGGIFYVSMKRGIGEELRADDRYGGVEKFWNYLSEDELADLIVEGGFQIIEQDTHEKSTIYQTHP
ncbi:MAG: class I SAM-dependent methyltransferase [Waddliaceae bacterium]